MRIELLHVPDCPNLELARARIGDALHQAGVRAVIRVIEVSTHTAADEAGMRGSPTILVNGYDAFPDGPADASVSCRLYPTPGGMEGAPTAEQLVEALTR